MGFGRSRHAFGNYHRRAVRLGLFSVCACHRPLASAGARFGMAGHFARSSVFRQDLPANVLAFRIIFPLFVSSYLFSKVVCACAAFRPHSPQFRGEHLAPTASDVLHNGVLSPGKHTGGPARASAGPVGPDACGLLAPSWVGLTSEARRLRSFGVRSSVPASFSASTCRRFFFAGCG